MKLVLFDKVVYMKGRVWTIYGTTDNGVFCYLGVKPYPTFEFDNYQHNKTMTISYFENKDLKFIEGDEIDWCMQKMESEDKKKLTRKKAIDFYVYLTGHSKNFVTKNLEEKHRSFLFSPGAVRYDLWKYEGALLLSHDLNDGFTQHTYFDFITFEHHGILNEKSREAHRQEIIDSYEGV